MFRISFCILKVESYNLLLNVDNLLVALMMSHTHTHTNFFAFSLVSLCLLDGKKTENYAKAEAKTKKNAKISQISEGERETVCLKIV